MLLFHFIGVSKACECNCDEAIKVPKEFSREAQVSSTESAVL